MATLPSDFSSAHIGREPSAAGFANRGPARLQTFLTSALAVLAAVTSGFVLLLVIPVLAPLYLFDWLRGKAPALGVENRRLTSWETLSHPSNEEAIVR